MERGSIYWVNLSDASPPEIGKIRPAVVVSNSSDNLRLPTVIAVPLSTKPPEAWPFRVGVATPGQAKKSFAIIPGMRQVSKKRLERRIGKLNATDLRRLDDAISAYLGD